MEEGDIICFFDIVNFKFRMLRNYLGSFGKFGKFWKFFKLNLPKENLFCSDDILLFYDFRRPQSNHGHGRGDTARHNHPLTSASRLVVDPSQKQLAARDVDLPESIFS